ncbi:hypothetical protein UCDDS831_g07185 [Diplodia seriata]|uniref:Uncharacterized protein n=1 Tax=Diplodia seriata TaxID=420778 RepID=A0A0G2DZB8_9PEZI|nr:hypothetical protein UCDDS831_g07185 [Diplodia seriata]
MSTSKLDAAKAIRNRLRAPTADERIELVTQMVTAIERDHPDRYPEVLDIVIGVYEASDKFVKEVQTPAIKPTVASPICEGESPDLTRSVPMHPPTETNRVFDPFRYLDISSDFEKVTDTSKAAERTKDSSMAKEPKKAKIANKASKAKTVAFKDGGEDDDDCSG